MKNWWISWRLLLNFDRFVIVVRLDYWNYLTFALNFNVFFLNFHPQKCQWISIMNYFSFFCRTKSESDSFEVVHAECALEAVCYVSLFHLSCIAVWVHRCWKWLLKMTYSGLFCSISVTSWVKLVFLGIIFSRKQAGSLS